MKRMVIGFGLVGLLIGGMSVLVFVLKPLYQFDFSQGNEAQVSFSEASKPIENPVAIPASEIDRTTPPETNAPVLVVATVNGEAITPTMIEAEVKISRLNVLAPLPPLTGEDLIKAQEEALNQLITRHLILQAAAREDFALAEAKIQKRADLLFGNYGDEALDQALRQIGATREDLLWWVSELTTVEEFTVQVVMAQATPEARHQVYNEWLNAQQAKADIKIFSVGATETVTAIVDNPAPNFTLNDLAGQSVSLSDYTGQIILLNFWATWCPSCTAEMPEYQAVYEHYGQQQTGDFIILGVNLQEDPAWIDQFTRGLGVTYPILLDSDGRVTSRQYQVSGMPTSFIIDRQGIIFYRHIGPMSGETLSAKLTELGL